ncbi:hypothetical protein EVAR_25415_1 [Eumeta japonica]|uniref:Uncharacterized protein n=1 Tax=Eumeta variegata TaxID=151549 RepID=A0A4C1V6Z1_EUMVA|nr:hypothetical protein EVAR_25415_1 [Eumeta japonica]
MSYAAFESPPANLLHHFAAPINMTEFLSFGQIISLCQEPHSTDVLVGRRHRRTTLTQIVNVNYISATTFELVEPVMNSGKGWSFIMKG